MASIQRTGKGYRVRWREGGRGAKMLSSPVYDRKDDAIDALERIAARIAENAKVLPGTILQLSTIFARWRENRVSLGNDPHWARSYVQRLHKITGDRWRTCREITPEAVNRWREAGGKARDGALLRSVLRWARDHHDQPVSEKTLVALRPPRLNRRPRPPLPDKKQITDWMGMAKKLSPDCEALIHCLATYGWRPITAAKLIVRDVDPARGVVRTQVKGGDVVEHPLLPLTLELIAPLAALRRPEDALFLDPRSGEPFGIDGPRAIPALFRKIFGGRVYDLKRHAISTMLAKGLPPQDVALFTGHRTLSQVLTYARTNEERARKALSRLKFVAHRGTPKPPRRDMTQERRAEKPSKSSLLLMPAHGRK